MSKSKPDAGAKETVLLRQAMPKYNFTARKLPKDTSKTSGSKTTQKISSTTTETKVQSDKMRAISPNSNKTTGTTQQLISSSQTPPTNSLSQTTDTQKSKPIAVVGASLQSASPSVAGNGKNGKSFTDPMQNLSVLSGTANSQSQSYLGVASMSQQSSVNENRNNDSCTSTSQDATLPGRSQNSASGASIPSQTHPQSLSAGTSNPHSSDTASFSSITFQTQAPSVDQTVALPSSHSPNTLTLLTTDGNLRRDQGHIAALECENDKLRKDLEVQLQVNTELKRLLVASVGDDLSERVERLCRDRAQLSIDLGGYSKKMSEEYENLDKVSIQADMWRSKYLASRVMIEELGNARAYYSLQCHDSQDALQQLLNERHELRTNLLETNKVLQQVKSAFDPLNSHRSSTLRSTNVLDLSRSCQQLAEAMRFRLLPAHIAVNIEAEIEDSLWSDSVTRAEQFAHEVLSRPTEPSGSLQSGSSRLLPLTASQPSFINRFHPHTRHENLTYNCCAKCKGEINVI